MHSDKYRAWFTLYVYIRVHSLYLSKAVVPSSSSMERLVSLKAGAEIRAIEQLTQKIVPNSVHTVCLCY